MKKIFTFFAVALMSVGMSFAEEINVTLDSNHADFEFKDRIAQSGWWSLTVSGARTYGFAMHTNRNCTQVTGSYTKDDLETLFLYKDGVSAGEITAAALAVTEQEGFFTVEGTLDCADGNTYIISLTYNYGEGIEDVTAETKAVKRIVDGQLVIEKNGKIYDATGAQIR